MTTHTGEHGKTPPIRFLIVTPVLNGARFIDETIMSVVSQAGNFEVTYHVQDGGSTDGTIEKLERWDRLLNGNFPTICSQFKFSFDVAQDGGVYSAINAAFGRFDVSSFDRMTWINADDLLDKTALHTVSAIISKFPHVDWLGGRTSLLAEDGTLTHHFPSEKFPQKAVAAGIFDGRHTRNGVLIQQEGSFWSPELWLKVGGVNGQFRYAGDYDLWRRFARHSIFTSVDRTTGYFRRREGQISGDMTSYHKEIDASFSKAELVERAHVAKSYREYLTDNELGAAGFKWRVAEYQTMWMFDERPHFISQSKPAKDNSLSAFKRLFMGKSGPIEPAQTETPPHLLPPPPVPVLIDRILKDQAASPEEQVRRIRALVS